MRKYNIALKGMIDNYRQEAKNLYLDTSYLSDEELYSIIEYWAGMSTQEETLEAVLEDIKNKEHR